MANKKKKKKSKKQDKKLSKKQSILQSIKRGITQIKKLGNKQSKKKNKKKKQNKKQMIMQNLLKEKFSEKKTIILIAAIALSVLIITIILSILLTGGKTKDEVPAPEPTPAPVDQQEETPPAEPPEDHDDHDDHDDFEEPERELSANELEFQSYEGPEMIMYHIWPETFRELIETADRSFMQEVEQVMHYRLSEQNDMLIRFMLIHERAETMLYKDESIAYGVPGLNIDIALFTALSSVEGIENILSENGIYEPVTDYIIFMHELYFEQRIPPTVVAYTENNVYFISIETIDGTMFTHVYTHNEYREKYKVHDGTLYVNEIMIPVPEERLTFEYRQVLAPLRVILEAIGSEIEIVSEETDFEEIFRYGADNLNITMFFSRNGKEYALEIERWAPGIIDLETGLYLIYVFPQDHLHFIHGRYSSKEEFEFYVDETVLRNILELVDATVEVDYDQRQVKVTS